VKKKLNRKQIRSLVLKEAKQLLEDAGSPDTESALEAILKVLNGKSNAYTYEIEGKAGEGQHIKVMGDEGNHLYNIAVTEV